MNIFLVITLLIFGILLLVAEVYLLPGIGVAFVGGMASLVASVWIAYVRISMLAGHLTLFAAIVLTVGAIYGFYRSRAMEKMSLDTTVDGAVELAQPGKKIEKLEQAAQQLEEQQDKTVNPVI